MMEKGKEQVISETADVSRQLLETSITRALVAQEIFAEIEVALHSAIEVNRATKHSENDTINRFSMENAYLTTLRFLDKLRQKYGVE